MMQEQTPLGKQALPSVAALWWILKVLAYPSLRSFSHSGRDWVGAQPAGSNS